MRILQYNTNEVIPLRFLGDSYYSAMGQGKNDYEGFYGITERMKYYGLHCHDFYELYIHYQGAKYFGIDNEVYLLQPNHLLIIPPFHMHGLLCEENMIQYERAYLYISSGFLSDMGCMQIDLEQVLLEKTLGNHFLFSLDADKAAECKHLLDLVQKNTDYSTWSQFTNVTRVLPVIHTMMEAEQTIVKSLPITTINPLMHKILVYINGHYMEPLTLRKLSEKFNISISTLSHEFIRYIHHSVYDYILYRRVMLAKQKLFEDIPLSEISDQCGFGDYSNFLRAFTKFNMIPPSEYGKQILRKLPRQS